jgi:hypothetical protein
MEKKSSTKHAWDKFSQYKPTWNKVEAQPGQEHTISPRLEKNTVWGQAKLEITLLHRPFFNSLESLDCLELPMSPRSSLKSNFPMWAWTHCVVQAGLELTGTHKFHLISLSYTCHIELTVWCRQRVQGDLELTLRLMLELDFPWSPGWPWTHSTSSSVYNIFSVLVYFMILNNVMPEGFFVFNYIWY